MAHTAWKRILCLTCLSVAFVGWQCVSVTKNDRSLSNRNADVVTKDGGSSSSSKGATPITTLAIIKEEINDMITEKQQQHRDDDVGFNWNTKSVLIGTSVDSFQSPVRYTCQGNQYDQFVHRLHRQAQQWVEQGLRPPTWGRRPSPLPPNFRLLIIGNSHARQVGMALAGQGRGGERRSDNITNVNQIRHIDPYHYDKNQLHKLMAQRYAYANNSTLYIVSNTVATYCPHPLWKRALEEQIEASLDSMDAIVMGRFNSGNQLDGLFDEFLPSDYGCGADQPPPSMKQLVEVYNGPVGFLPMFGSHYDKVAKESQRILQKLKTNKSRKTATFRPRLYVDLLQHKGGFETWLENMHGSKTIDKFAPGQCVNSKTEAGHRCVGRGGGLPDLMAWDLSEFMYNLVLQG